MGTERIIRVAAIPEDAHPLSVLSGDPPMPLPARWAAIAICPSSPPRYVLYLLGDSGEILEALQYESMRIALDQARALTRLRDASWSTSEIETPDGDFINPNLFLGYLAGQQGAAADDRPQAGDRG